MPRLICDYCKCGFDRETKRINQNRKRGWFKDYCSSVCSQKSRKIRDEEYKKAYMAEWNRKFACQSRRKRKAKEYGKYSMAYLELLELETLIKRKSR